MSLKKKIWFIILLIVLLLLASGVIYAHGVLQGISGEQLDESTLSVNTMLDEGIVNIALFGIDGRDDVDGDRSDTIMIASVDFSTGNVKITSVMRDLMVRIPETEDTYPSYEKINSAYSYGGPQLAVQALNENFDLNITDYVVVNFDCLVDTVDALGGVDINVENEDILEWTNKYIDDVNDKVGKNDPYLETTGEQHVTGVQALAYCRNRYSDSDYKRTERQREVVSQIIQKGMTIDLLQAINLMSDIYPYIQTSLSFSEMSAYAQSFLSADSKAISDFRISVDKLSSEETLNGTWYLVPNTLADNALVLHYFIYGTVEDYTPSETVLDITDKIAYYGSTPTGVTIDPMMLDQYIETDEEIAAEEAAEEASVTEQPAVDPTVTEQPAAPIE